MSCSESWCTQWTTASVWSSFTSMLKFKCVYRVTREVQSLTKRESIFCPELTLLRRPPVGTWLVVSLFRWDWPASQPPTQWPDPSCSDLWPAVPDRGATCVHVCACVPVCCLCVLLPLLSFSDCSRSSSSSWTLVATVDSTSLFSSCPQSRCCYWNKGKQTKQQ